MADRRDVIAVREYELDGQDGAVRVELDRPMAATGHPDFRCTFRISGLSRERASHAYGVDAVQAINLALIKIHAILSSSGEYQQGRLTWLGGEDGDLGLPIADGVSGRST